MQENHHDIKSVYRLLVVGFVDVLLTASACFLSNSTVLLADFLKTVLEFIAILLSCVTVWQLNRAVKHSNYEYGIGKLENISSLLVAFLMLICFCVIIYSAFKSLFSCHTSIGGIGLTISLYSQVLFILVNGYFYIQNKNLYKIHQTPIMESQVKLFLTRLIGSIFVIISLLSSISFQKFSWSLYIDPVSSFVLAIMIIGTIIGLLSNSLGELLDKTLEEERQIIIIGELAKYFEDYEELHTIRSRRSGTKIYIEIFLEFDMDKKFFEVKQSASKICNAIEEKLYGSSVSITIASTRNLVD